MAWSAIQARSCSPALATTPAPERDHFVDRGSHHRHQPDGLVERERQPRVDVAVPSAGPELVALEVVKTGPGNMGRRKRLSDAIRYLDERSDKMSYGSLRTQDLEVGTGQVEGAVKHVVAKRCDHGGMEDR